MKLGIVGTGIIVKEFLSIADQLSGVEVAAICSTKKSEETGRELAGKYNIEQVFTDYAEMLACDVDTIYVALPNHLHYQFAKEALEAGRNVVVEKPFASNDKEALFLSTLAREKRLFLFEAITTLYLPNYKKIKELLPELGEIKIVQCNLSQYSRRYDSFKSGQVLPAFDPKLSGGALMDLNTYNIHYVTGLFGKPEGVEYFPNVERGIDTSGILILNYGTFQCTLTGAKDCNAPIANNIQGNKGCIHLKTSTNVCKEFELIKTDGTSTLINENDKNNRMVYEFVEFQEMIQNHDLERCYRLLDHSLIVSQIQTTARAKGGIHFPADDQF
jgi:predicted dehydrogenase